MATRRVRGWLEPRRPAEDRTLAAPTVEPAFTFTGTTAPLNVSTGNVLAVSDAWACVQLLSNSISTAPACVPAHAHRPRRCWRQRPHRATARAADARLDGRGSRLADRGASRGVRRGVPGEVQGRRRDRPARPDPPRLGSGGDEGPDDHLHAVAADGPGRRGPG